MKKLFTLALIFCIFVTGLGVRVNAQETAEEDESYLTIEVIENSFWEELESCKYPQITKEDEYLIWLIEEIREPHVIPAFGDLNVISARIREIKEDEVDIDRLLYKCQRIVDLYNFTHDLQLKIEKKKFTPLKSEILIQSEIPDYIKYLVTMTGQLAHVKADTVYWECAQNFGSGISGVIEETRVVQVNGVAYLDENGEVISSYYGTTPQQIEKTAERMLHICIGDTDLGWVYPTQLTCIDE